MGNKKISELPLATTLASASLEIIQGGLNKQAPISLFGSSITPFVLESIISGTTKTLAHTPVSAQGYYLNGQRCSIGAGKIITSIVGTLVTFDSDYTGADFTETYNY